MATTRPTFFRMAVAAAVGRVAILILLRQHWHWQPPYHTAYLIPADWYDPVLGEYLVAHMPLYAATLRLLGRLPVDIYTSAPVVQHVLQILAIGRLAATLGAVVPARWPARPIALALLLGLDPWLCDTAMIMQPACLTATLYILLIERCIVLGSRARVEERWPWIATVATAGVLCGVGAYARADFAASAPLLPAAVGLMRGLARPAPPLRQTVVFTTGTMAASLALVVALLMPRSLWLRATTGSFVLTTHTGGGTMWYGLGEIPNPWRIPNPDTGDQPIFAFARAHGYDEPYASARTEAFFKALFTEHVRERPAFLLKVMAYRVHRVLLGWPPSSVALRGDYETWPQASDLGKQLSLGRPWYRLLASRKYGPWVIKQLGLRYLGTALIWMTFAGALAWLLRYRTASPLLLLPALAYATGVGVFLLVHWTWRYGQMFYWLGYLAGYFLLARTPLPAARPDHTVTPASSPAHPQPVLL